MTKPFVLALFIASLLTILPKRSFADSLEQQLVRNTQELMDAVAPGNQEPWKKILCR